MPAAKPCWDVLFCMIFYEWNGKLFDRTIYATTEIIPNNTIPIGNTISFIFPAYGSVFTDVFVV